MSPSSGGDGGERMAAPAEPRRTAADGGEPTAAPPLRAAAGTVVKQMEVRWRDLDAFGHVNNAVYLTYLEEARDEWLNSALPESGSAWDFVLARVAIDFRRELREADEHIVTSCRLVRIGRSSVVTREEVRTLDGELSAEAESVLVARDPETGRSRPLSADERDAFARGMA